MSLRSSSQQPPLKYVKCDRLQPRIKPVTEDLSPARGTARPLRIRESNRTRSGVLQTGFTLFLSNLNRTWTAFFKIPKSESELNQIIWVFASLNRFRTDWKSGSLREITRVTLKAACIQRNAVLAQHHKQYIGPSMWRYVSLSKYRPPVSEHGNNLIISKLALLQVGYFKHYIGLSMRRKIALYVSFFKLCY